MLLSNLVHVGLLLGPGVNGAPVQEKQEKQEVVNLGRNFDLTIYTNNVRYPAPYLKRKEFELPWEDRKSGVIQTIISNTKNGPSLVGLQETKYQPLKDVLRGLNAGTTGDWVHFGVGRDDGKKKGEYAPVLYDSNEWKLLNGTTRWLSKTPLEPSKYPTAGSIRIVTLTTLEHRKTSERVNFINTHLDDRSEEARDYGVRLIDSYIQQIPNSYPVFLSGDFNSVATDPAYKLAASALSDSSSVASKDINANLPSFSGFANASGTTIDFIFSKPGINSTTQIDVINHEVIDNLFDYGHRFSDHRPVLASFSLIH
ncbi:uncharacterized protein LODBEIA_P45520 [Lodderomyces beijingensis]|uniref:Endonuclease/exonuclease/phosphatase domain-containing protein n=1 Tax=Lodderomyces beijingensis TaxID=1775926 RepID=A0ABP0ZQA4_9ASCO